MAHAQCSFVNNFFMSELSGLNVFRPFLTVFLANLDIFWTYFGRFLDVPSLGLALHLDVHV